MWDRADGSQQELTPEEEEMRSAARRKMVGNLRFIGELGKLEIINESILHNCIQQVLMLIMFCFGFSYDIVIFSLNFNISLC